MTKSIAIFGASGSVGSAALDLIRRQPEAYGVRVLTADRAVGKMANLIGEFKPAYAVMANETAARELRACIDGPTQVLSGPDGLIHAAQCDYDLMISAIVGFAGLAPTYAALCAGRDVALANKEALVCAGALIREAAQASGARILPVDSEHNAIFQCWQSQHRSAIESVQLTGSGGPFRGWTASQIRQADLSDALKHPNWSMGPKITIDSATLMNKALEMIEARWLFDLRPDQLEVVIHPQSIVHSCVTYRDGSTLAQLGCPDMRTPLAYCLAYPERAPLGGQRLNLTDLKGLTFEQADEDAFPTLNLARTAMGETSPAFSLALNGVNEVLNAAVRKRELPFGRLIPGICEVMAQVPLPMIAHMDQIIAYDREIRDISYQKVRAWSS